MMLPLDPKSVTNDLNGGANQTVSPKLPANTYLGEGYYNIPGGWILTPKDFGYIMNSNFMKIWFDNSDDASKKTFPKTADGFMTLYNGYSVHPDRTVRDPDGKIVHIDPSKDGGSESGGDESENVINKVTTCIMFETPSLEEAVQEADAVVNGEVVAISEALMDQSKLVYRLATVRVEENMYGADATQEIKVIVLGGTYNGVEYEYLDSKKLSIGDRMTLVLNKTSSTARDRGVSQSTNYQVIADTYAYPISSTGTRSSELTSNMTDYIR